VVDEVAGIPRYDDDQSSAQLRYPIERPTRLLGFINSVRQAVAAFHTRSIHCAQSTACRPLIERDRPYSSVKTLWNRSLVTSRRPILTVKSLDFIKKA
jgi:hypothetical protein